MQLHAQCCSLAYVCNCRALSAGIPDNADSVSACQHAFPKRRNKYSHCNYKVTELID